MTTFPPKSPCPTCGSDLTLSAAPPVQMEAVAWRPIETAPTDGTQVDLWCRRSHGISAGGYGRVPDCWHSAGKWWRNDDNGDDMLRSEVHNATHWMPRPNSPFATNASPVPSSERDVGMRAKLASDLLTIAARLSVNSPFGWASPDCWALQQAARILSDEPEPNTSKYPEGVLSSERDDIDVLQREVSGLTDENDRLRAERDDIIEMCAARLDARAQRHVSSTVRDRAMNEKKDYAAASLRLAAEELRSLKSQPAQEAE